MSKNPEPYQLEPWRKELLARAFEGLPQDYDALSSALSALREAFHLNVAAKLGPALNTHLAEIKADTFAERDRTAKWVDQVTRELGVTTADPKTGKPGIIIAEQSQWPGQSGVSNYAMVIKTERVRGLGQSGFGGVDIGDQLTGDRLTGAQLTNVHLIPAPPGLEKMFAMYRTRSRGGRTV